MMNTASSGNGTSVNRYTVPSVRTAINILGLLKRRGHRRLSLAEICKALGVSKSSAFTVLKTLQDADYVSYDELGKKYSLGLGLLELGGVVADEMDDLAVARPFVHELATQTQETSIIVRWDGRQFVVLHCEEPTRPVRVTVNVGQHFRFLTGALGKAYLAYASEEFVKHILNEAALRAYTPHSVTEIQKFIEELALCRKLGYAESFEESILGVNAVAAPVLDKNGSVVLVIGILGFSSSLPPELVRRDGALVKEAAIKTSAALGNLSGTREEKLDEPMTPAAGQ